MKKVILLLTVVFTCGFVTGKDNIDKYDYVKNFKKGFQYVIKGDCVGLINKKGELILSIEYDDIDSYSYKKKYVFIYKDGGRGLFSLVTGKIIIPPKYGDIEKFKRGNIEGFKAYGKNYKVVEFSLDGNAEKTYTHQCFYTCLGEKE